MIKVFTNKSTSPKVRIESKFLRDKTTIVNPNNNGYVENINENLLLFVKLNFSELMNSQKIGKVQLALGYQDATSSFGLKVIKASNTDISDANIKTLATNLTGNESIMESCIVYGGDHSLSHTGVHFVTLDITNIVKTSNAVNPTIMLIIRNDNIGNNIIKLFDPETISNENEVVHVVCNEVGGINTAYEYDEHNVGTCGNGYVNLFTGKQIHTFDTFTTKSKKVPIEPAIIANRDKLNDVSLLKNNLTLNYQYRVYKDGDDYVVEDATGMKRYYYHLSLKDGESYPSDYGIKHTNKYTDIDVYLCNLDYSYIFVPTSSGSSYNVHLFDKEDNHMEFKISSSKTKILLQENSLGKGLTFVWSGDLLEKITNTDNDEVIFSYDSNSFLVKIDFKNESRYVEISYTSTTSVTLGIYYHYLKSQATIPTKEKLSEIKLTFSANFLTSIEDLINGYVMSYSKNTSYQVTEVEFKNSSNESSCKNSYYYNNNYTRVTDYENKQLYFYFDNFGRVRTIMDDKAKTITYNYDEFENGESKNLIGVSKVQNNSRNLIENHSFENDELGNSDLLGWQVSGATNSILKSLNDGVYGEKCLFIDKSISETVTIKQTISNQSVGSFMLKGFAKCRTKDESTLATGSLTIQVRGNYTIYDERYIEIPGTTNKVLKAGEFVDEYSAKFDNFADYENWKEFKTPTITIPSGAYNIEMYVEIIAKGLEYEVYVDELQLGNSEQLTRYNLINNGYMEFVNSSTNRPKSWQFSNFSSKDVIATVSSNDEHSPMLGNNVMSIATSDNARNDSDFIKKKMYQIVNTRGLAGDELIFSVFAKCNATSSNILRSYIKFYYEKQDIKYYNFDFEKNFDNWQMLTRSVTAEHQYTSIEVGVEYDGCGEALFDCFQLYKDTLGKYYNYNERGNITEIMDANGTSTRIEYDDNKVSEIYAQDGSHFIYRYDNSGRLDSVEDINGNKITISYDSNDNIVSKVITTSSGEMIKTSQKYDDNNCETNVVNEYNEETIRGFNQLNIMTSEKLPNGVIKEYNYDNKLQLLDITTKVDSLNYSNSLTYNKEGLIKTIESSNGSKYELIYGSFGKITKIIVNDETLQTLEYGLTKNGINSGLLTRNRYGTNGDYYDFVYNDLGELITVKFNDTAIVNYEYNENGQVSKLVDISNNITKYYSYNYSGQIIQEYSEICKINYSYDNLKKLQKKTLSINGRSRSYDFEYEYEFNEYSKDGYFNRIDNAFNDEIIRGRAYGVHGAKPILYTQSNIYDEDVKMRVLKFDDKYDFIWYNLETINKDRTSGFSNGGSFNYEAWKNRFVYNKMFYMWIKPTGSFGEEENLFEFEYGSQDESGKHNVEAVSGLYITKNGYIGYRSEGTISYNVTLNKKPTINEWNLIGVRLYKELGNTYYNCEIYLNDSSVKGMIDENVEKITYVVVAGQDVSKIVIGSSKDGTVTNKNLTLPFNIAMISIGAYGYSFEDVKAIYNEGKKYLRSNAPTKSNGTIYYKKSVYDKLDVISLNGSLESTNGLKPYELMITDKSFKVEKARIFKYDNISQKHVYGSYDAIANLIPGNNSLLSYKLELNNTGSITIRFKLDSEYEITKNRCIISMMNGTNEVFGAYVNLSNKVIFYRNNIAYATQSELELDTWYTLTIVNDETLKVYINESLIYQPKAISLADTITYIGNTRNEQGTYLYGLLEMFAYSNESLTTTEICNLSNYGNPIIIRNKLDSLGRTTEKQILVNNNEFKTTYTYDKLRVTKEVDQKGNSIEYAYDEVGNITSKTFKSGSLTNSKASYTYDKLGRLTREVKENGEIETFTYDTNGNVKTHKLTKNGSIIVNEEYLYDSTVKDRLTSIKDLLTNYTTRSFLYYNSYKGNPTSMTISGVTRELTWSGKRLTKIGNDIEYAYNEEGIRIKKVTPNETTSFILEGNNILSMNKTKSNGEIINFDFSYDSNGELIGLTYKDKEYFYSRDITKNINGIIDENGEYVVKYSYDAWGNLLNTTIISGNEILENNPFIYKGYFYDSETGLFYLKSRYYDPTLRRFINMDDFNQINTEDFNGLNLYSYCNNNPVIYYDINGHEIVITIGTFFAILTGLLLFALLYIAISNIVREHPGSSSISNPFDQIEEGLENLKKAIGLTLASIAVEIFKYVSSRKAKKDYQEQTEDHHIVARIDRRAKRARNILYECGIDLDDPRNIVTLKKGYHKIVHTNLYYAILDSSIYIAYKTGGEAGVNMVLKIFKKALEEKGGLK